MKKTVLFLSALSLLGACGGGGGGGALLPVPPAPPAELAPQTDNGYLVSVESVQTSDTEVIVNSIGEMTRSNLSQTENGDLIVAGKHNVGSDLNATEFAHSTYGHWFAPDGTNAPDVDTYASFGEATPSSNMPRADARYRGRSGGFIRNNVADRVDLTHSEIQIDATNGFRYIEIESFATGYANLQSGAFGDEPAYDFTGKGQITGSGFEVSIQNNDAALDLSGTTQGQFYGPNAEEVGGVFKMTGTNGSAYVGSFGATR